LKSNDPPAAPLVTIVIPNWNTGPLLRLCLASLARFTQTPHTIIVVDNGSDDASRRTAEGAAANGLIKLIKRDDTKNEGANAHSGALDAGLAATTTPLMLALDSDAWARRDGWLGEFVNALGEHASHAGATKFPGGRLKSLFARFRRGPKPPEASYIRPCHALYRVALLREHALSFAPHQLPSGRWRTTGEHLHARLGELGHEPATMPHTLVAALVGHLYHATIVLNASRFPTLRERARVRGERRIRRWLESSEAAAILEGTPVP
jgi:glycosyltransferase involved in cell wall biosynthesis